MIVNEAKTKNSAFLGMVTLINLCEDDLAAITLHLPPHWRNANFFLLDNDGEWNKLTVTKTGEGIEIDQEIRFCEPVYLLVQEEKQ